MKLLLKKFLNEVIKNDFENNFSIKLINKKQMNSIITFILITWNLYKWIIILNIVLSFLRVSPQNKLYLFSSDILNPLYNQIRKIPHSIWIFDFTPLIAIILIDLILFIIQVNFGIYF